LALLSSGIRILADSGIFLYYDRKTGIEPAEERKSIIEEEKRGETL